MRMLIALPSIRDVVRRCVFASGDIEGWGPDVYICPNQAWFVLCMYNVHLCRPRGLPAWPKYRYLQQQQLPRPIASTGQALLADGCTGTLPLTRHKLGLANGSAANLVRRVPGFSTVTVPTVGTQGYFAAAVRRAEHRVHESTTLVRSLSRPPGPSYNWIENKKSSASAS